MKIELNIGKKTIAVILVLVVIAAALATNFGGITSILFPKQIAFSSGREASDAITNLSTDIDQVGSIIDDIDKKLGG